MQWLLDLDHANRRDLHRISRPRTRRSGSRIAYHTAMAALSAIAIAEVALLAMPGLKAQLLSSLAMTSPGLSGRSPAPDEPVLVTAGPDTLSAEPVVVVGPLSPLPASPAAAPPVLRPQPSSGPAVGHPPAALPLVAAVARPEPAPQRLPAPPTVVTAARPSAPPAAAPRITLASAPRATPPAPHALPRTAPPPARPAPPPATAVPPHATILVVAPTPPPPIEAAPAPPQSPPDMTKPLTVPQPSGAGKAAPPQAEAPKPAVAASTGQAPAAPQARPAAHAAATPAPPTATPPLDPSLRVELSFTADEAGIAAAFAHQLERQGFAVTSLVIPATGGRWPGVAFFFDSDRAEARAIAQQLGAVTGRPEHARLSPRHPYPKPGTVEVSLLSDQTTEASAPGQSGETHRPP